MKLVRIDAPKAPPRTGFPWGQARIPDDFDTVHSDEIADLFGALQ